MGFALSEEHKMVQEMVRDFAGANGYSNEFPVERYMRNAKGAVIYEGTAQIHTIMQAEYALGFRKDKPLRMPVPKAQGY